MATVSIGNEKLFNKLLSNIVESLTSSDGKKTDSLERFEKVLFGDVISKDYEGLKKTFHSRDAVDEVSSEETEIKENYSDQDIEDSQVNEEEAPLFNQEQIQEEADIILRMIVLSLEIKQNKKADALIDALTQQFEKAKNEGCPEKAVIFTEFRSTQDYILRKLTEMGIDIENEVVIFNGDSGDAEERRLLVKQFKNTKKIFLTTEAGSEGLNLQFCNLIINYDLPWNPQRIEQRIGRCHRYGQKLDVIVVNFVNTKNAADLRVLKLLQEKFNLFRGAFGASDEVLGDIEDGHDVEKEILKIYMSCRTQDEINEAFERLQISSSDKISEKLNETKNIVLEQFDEDVHSKLKLQLDEAEKRVDSISKMFWGVTKIILKENANFDDEKYVFELKNSPFEEISPGQYKLGSYRMIAKGQDRGDYLQNYRLSHPLGEKVIEKAKSLNMSEGSIKFDVSGHDSKISILEELIGETGWIEVLLLNVSSLDKCEELVYIGISDNGESLSEEQVKKIFNVPAFVSELNEVTNNSMNENLGNLKKEALKCYLKKIETRNYSFFMDESEKLDKWSEDIKEGLEVEIKELDKEIKKVKKESKNIALLDEKVKAQRVAKNLEKKRNDMRRKLFEEQDRIEEEKEKLIEDIEKRMKLEHKEKNIVQIKWEIV